MCNPFLNRVRKLICLLPLAALIAALPSCRSHDTRILSAPDAFILPHILARADRVYVCEREGWSEEVLRSGIAASNRIVTVPSFDAKDRPDAGYMSSWTTDEWLFGWKGDRTVVLHMPGDQGLAEWGTNHFKAMISSGAYLDPFAARAYPENRFDEGGAVMASPPVPGFPAGRIVIARNTCDSIKDYFKRQGTQAGPRGRLVEVDTSWLKVGHVDELVNFMPASAPPGFKLVYPDPGEGLRILKTVPEDRVIFWGNGCKEYSGKAKSSGNRWLVTAEAVPGEKWRFVRIWKGKGAGQIARIHQAQADKIVIEHVWNTADVPDEDDAASPARGMAMAIEGRCDTMPIWFNWPDETSRFLLVTESKMWMDASGEEFPAFMAAGELAGDREFERVNKTIAARCRKSAEAVLKELGLKKTDSVPVVALFVAYGSECRGAFAFSPSLVNLQTFDKEVITLLPFGPRSDVSRDGSDIFLSSAEKALTEPGTNLHFVEGWNPLHRQNGGARCGMNVWKVQ
jgi:hypothetical protein